MALLESDSHEQQKTYHENKHQSPNTITPPARELNMNACNNDSRLMNGLVYSESAMGIASNPSIETMATLLESQSTNFEQLESDINNLHW